MKYNAHNKVTSPKTHGLKLTVANILSQKKSLKKIPRGSVNTVITHNYDLWSLKSYEMLSY